jgi:molybdopterin/thiamine biosynthesis adenylyltransferase
MRPTLVDHNEDLRRLWDEGFNLEIFKDKYLLVHDIPYLDKDKKIRKGTLVTVLELAGDKTVSPVADHVADFIGEAPYDENGVRFPHIIHEQPIEHTPGLTINYRFSSKPRQLPNQQYPDYYVKVKTYVAQLLSSAQHVDPDISAKSLKVYVPEESDSVFNYADTNSSRAEVDTITDKLKGQVIGIVGLGGTGSYVLDLVAKTPVSEIHLFDGDHFRNHNAFRAPGAASLDTLREHWKKVQYLHAIYSKMHRNIHPHDYDIREDNMNQLGSMNFVFLCMDPSEVKRSIINFLFDQKIPFIDVGIGVLKKEDQLRGHVKTTTGLAETKENIEDRITFKADENNIYNKNIQIADLNCLNATLAVIKWKKIFGFYLDDTKEFNSVYTIRSNKIFNDAADTDIH